MRSMADSSKDNIGGTYRYIKYYDVINIPHTDHEYARKKYERATTNSRNFI